MTVDDTVVRLDDAWLARVRSSSEPGDGVDREVMTLLRCLVAEPEPDELVDRYGFVAAVVAAAPAPVTGRTVRRRRRVFARGAVVSVVAGIGLVGASAAAAIVAAVVHDPPRSPVEAPASRPTHGTGADAGDASPAGGARHGGGSSSSETTTEVGEPGMAPVGTDQIEGGASAPGAGAGGRSDVPTTTRGHSGAPAGDDAVVADPPASTPESTRPGEGRGNGPGSSNGNGPGSNNGVGPGSSNGVGPGSGNGGGPGSSNGVGPGSNNGVGPGSGNGVGPGSNNGVGPGSSNGKGPGSNSGNGPGANNGVGPGSSNGVGPGSGNGVGPSADRGKGPRSNGATGAASPACQPSAGKTLPTFCQT